MYTNTLEEAELTDQTNEQQTEPPVTTASPEPEEVKPDTQEQEQTVLVTTEPEVIEGEVIELEQPDTSEDHLPPQHKPYWLLIPFTILFCLVFVSASFLLPLLAPTATVTIIPVGRTITRTTVIQVHGRQLLPLTLTQSLSAPATGKRHQDATRAGGTITFYNGLLTSQTIAGGTVLTGSDGVQVITDLPAIIPAANPPFEGHITIPAHALSAGAGGNIQAYDINQACCATSVVAKNTSAFTGGAAARDFLAVRRTDINTAVTSLLLTLSESENAALQAQLRPGEALAVSTCTPHVASNHKPGDVATQVTVTVSDTCGGIAYTAHEVYTDATQLLKAQATTTLGAEYALLGNIQVAIVHATAGEHRQGSLHLVVQVTGTWVYQITPAMQQHLLRLIAGKTKQQASASLLQIPGIAGVQISAEGGNRTLPEDPRRIHIIVVYLSASL
jgi:hypothetical protein